MEKVLQQPRDPRIRFAYGNIDRYALGNRPGHPGIVRVWGFRMLFSARTVPVCISVSLPISLPVSLPVSSSVSVSGHVRMYVRRFVDDTGMMQV